MRFRKECWFDPGLGYHFLEITLIFPDSTNPDGVRKFKKFYCNGLASIQKFKEFLC
ncbi:hypothetical protein AGR4B_Lc60375 [Agrobacterium tumefaciens str. CFBP 5621]|nr:hypothetical protein AGR4B_Lc60375 [Agrobacterium tumefaciens str. CFBP 5621]